MLPEASSTHRRHCVHHGPFTLLNTSLDRICVSNSSPRRPQPLSIHRRCEPPHPGSSLVPSMRPFRSEDLQALSLLISHLSRCLQLAISQHSCGCEAEFDARLRLSNAPLTTQAYRLASWQSLHGRCGLARTPKPVTIQFHHSDQCISYLSALRLTLSAVLHLGTCRQVAEIQICKRHWLRNLKAAECAAVAGRHTKPRWASFPFFSFVRTSLSFTSSCFQLQLPCLSALGGKHTRKPEESRSFRLS